METKITLICQLDECFYSDGEVIHTEDLAIKYPDTIEEAASDICQLRMWRSSHFPDHRCDGWQITILLDGREQDDLDDTHAAIVSQIDARAATLVLKAEEERKRKKQEEEEQASADRAKYEQLKTKYGW